MSVTCRLLVLSLAIVTLMSSAGSGEARPTDWIFTGHFYVEDPSGNPMAKAPVAMDGYTRYNFRQESDPDSGVFWVWDTASCSARGMTDSQGQATLSCSIPWEQAEQPGIERASERANLARPIGADARGDDDGHQRIGGSRRAAHARQDQVLHQGGCRPAPARRKDAEHETG